MLTRLFPPELEQNAFQTGDGEFGWTRAQIPLVVGTLRSNLIAILGGELWWTYNAISGAIPQRSGPPAVYGWETNRGAAERWTDFVARSASETLAAVERWPDPEDLPVNLPGQILYNLTWITEPEFEGRNA